VREIPPLLAAPAAELRTIRFVAFDFDGVFTDDAVYVGQDGTEMVRCWRGDGLGLRKLERRGIATAILSTEVNPVVAVRSQKLGIQCRQGLEDKRAALLEVAAGHRIALEEIAYVGNDINDLLCFAAVALPIGVRNAHADVLACVRYRTDAAGGHGAVREVCDVFDRAYAAV
jgi:YrbI family 3-deoxy-D-manno-octulosonate 8-phosphate phosphatase